MKKNSITKKAVYIFISIFLYSLLQTSLATASEPDQIIKALKAQKCEKLKNLKKEKYIASIRACRGEKIAHTDQKVVALTFDDGPSEKYTTEILDVLKDNNISATFFMIGKNIVEYPDIVKKAFENGNVIANHSFSHHYLSKLEGIDIAHELIKTNELILNITGFKPKLFRPPYGSCSDKSRRVARNLKLKTILWSATAKDFNPNTTPEEIANNTMALVKPGAIILLHDGGGNRTNTIAALKIIITKLKKQDYEFLTVPELLNIPAYIAPQPKYSGLMLAAKQP